MYKIVNYDYFQSCPTTFNDFDSAFMIQQLKYPDHTIEHWCDSEVKVVWDPTWENKVTYNIDSCLEDVLNFHKLLDSEGSQNVCM